jgi:hypothetical protein
VYFSNNKHKTCDGIEREINLSLYLY